MAIFRTYSQPSVYIEEAKEALVLARYWKQAAKLARDFAYAYPAECDPETWPRRVSKWENRAKLYRRRARQYLIEHEKVIGTFYALGVGFGMSLKDRLSGGDFKDWSQYEENFHPEGKHGKHQDIWL